MTLYHIIDYDAIIDIIATFITMILLLMPYTLYGWLSRWAIIDIDDIILIAATMPHAIISFIDSWLSHT